MGRELTVHWRSSAAALLVLGGALCSPLSWAQADPGGRGYSKQFMSFGLSAIEIPIAQIRASLANRLAKDLLDWWLNDSAILPAQMLE